MTAKELASARSFWKRRELRAGRRSRFVEVREVSLETVRADAVENGLVDNVVALLGTGKEADVYIGMWKGTPLAPKVYRIHRTSHRKHGAIGYAPDRMGAIAAREFTILQKAYRGGVPVPTPARRVDNMFTMRFLGTEKMAPSLRRLDPEKPEELAREAVGIVEKLLDAFIVHGDLSEYNILSWNDRLYVIDFPQAVDFSSKVDRHQKTREAAPLLLRDLQNVETYFKRHGVSVNAREVFTRLLPNLQPDMGALGSESLIADGKELR